MCAHAGCIGQKLDGKTSFLRDKLLFYFRLLKNKSDNFSDIFCHFYLEMVFFQCVIGN